MLNLNEYSQSWIIYHDNAKFLARILLATERVSVYRFSSFLQVQLQNTDKIFSSSPTDIDSLKNDHPTSDFIHLFYNNWLWFCQLFN